MPAFLVDLAVIGTVCYAGWLGSDRGIFEMAAIGLQLFASIVLAVLLLEPLASALGGGIEAAIGPFLPESISIEAWALFLSFLLLSWLPFLVLFVNVHPRLMAGGDMKSVSTIEKIGGTFVGGIVGLLALGALLLTLSLLPFLNGLKVNGNNLYFDLGSVVLNTASRFTGEWHEGRSLVMEGEPASRESVPEALLSSEPLYDVDENGEPSDADRFSDVDGNGSFTKDLYYLDIDGDTARRVGMVEKYVVGCWSGEVVIKDRQRPTPQSQRAPSPAEARQGAAQRTASVAEPAPPNKEDARKPPEKPLNESASDEEDVVVVLVDEDGNVISEEEMAEGDVEVVEEVVEETADDGETVGGKP